jgi:hypothetical protein
MKRLVLLFFAAALSAGAQTQVLVGGFQTTIPRPDVALSSNLLGCANFSCGTAGSAPPSPWNAVGGCAGCTLSNTHIHQTGGLSLLLPNAGTGSATLVQQTVTWPGALGIRETGYAYTDVPVSGQFTFLVDGPVTDVTHGNVFPSLSASWAVPQAIGSTNGTANIFAPNSQGWFLFKHDFWITPTIHTGDTWKVGFRVPNGTDGVGNTYLGDLSAYAIGWAGAWYPAFPGEPVEGYWFADEMPTVTQCGGTANNMPALKIGLWCGRIEVQKPANVTLLSSMHVTMEVSTSPFATGTCSGGTPVVTGSGSTAISNYSATANVIPVAFDASSWTTQNTPTTPYYVCLITVDTQNSITYTWPEYVIYPLNKNFYGSFNVYPNPDNSLVHLGQPFSVHGTYDNPNSAFNYGGAINAENWTPSSLCPTQATATASWANCIAGVGDLFETPISPVWTNASPPSMSGAIFKPKAPAWTIDLAKHKYNSYLPFSFVTQNPTPGNSDSYGGLYEATADANATMWLILNAWHGTLLCLGWQDATCDIPTAPSAATVTSSGGSIAPPSTWDFGTQNCTPNCYMWVETAPGGWGAPGQAGDTPLYGLSSPPIVSSTALSGSTNQVAVTFAACGGRQDYTILGVSWSNSNSVQPPPDTFQPVSTTYPECPATTATLTGSQTTSSTDTGDLNQTGSFPAMMPANDVTSGDIPTLSSSNCAGSACGTVTGNIVAQCVSPTKLTIPSNQLGVAAGTVVTAPSCPGSGFTGVYFSYADNAGKASSPINWWKFSLIQYPGSPLTPGSGTFTVPTTANAPSNVEIPTDLSANGAAASWMSGLSEYQVLASMANTVCQGADATNFPNATKAASFVYPWDEADTQTKRNMQVQLLGTNGWKSYCPGSMSFSAANSASVGMARFLVDIPGADPYDYGLAAGAETFQQGTSCRTAAQYGGTWNALTAPAANCNIGANVFLPQVTDWTMRAICTWTYGTAPIVTVDMNYARLTAQHGYTYAELFRSAVRHIIESWECGSNSGGQLWWARYQMGTFVNTYGNTQAEIDTTLVDKQIDELFADVGSQPIVDSSYATGLPGMFEPGLNTIVSKVEYFAADGSGNPITMATACNIPTVANNFTDTTQYPNGAMKVVTKFSALPSAANPDQRVFTVWPCGGPNSNSTGGVAVFVRYTSPNLPPGQTQIAVRWEGRNITIGNNATCPGVTLAANQWCDGWNGSSDTINDFQVRIYNIDQVRHNRGTGSVAGTGSISSQ